MKRVCVLLFFLACSSETQFASVYITTPTGKEVKLDRNYCSKKQIKKFEESAKSYESISVGHGNYDSLDLQQNRLDAENYRFFVEICSLIVKGYVFTSEGKELALEQRKLYEEREKIREEHHKFLFDTSYDNADKVDALYRDRIENGKEIKALQDRLLKELVKP